MEKNYSTFQSQSEERMDVKILKVWKIRLPIKILYGKFLSEAKIFFIMKVSETQTTSSKKEVWMLRQKEKNDIGIR